MNTVHLGDKLAAADLKNKVSDLEDALEHRAQNLRQALDYLDRAIRERVLSNGLTSDIARFRARAPS